MPTLDLPDPFNLIALETVGSTNTEAISLAERGTDAAPDYTLIWAREQTGGKGRRGRDWVSPPGNLYTSILLRPEATVVETTAFGFIAANAVVEALSGLAPNAQKIQCKWPNDVLLNGKKVAGILMETVSGQAERPNWLVVGMGLNIESHPDGTEFPATSLRAEGWDTPLETVLTRYCERFLDWSRCWSEEGFSAVRKTWLANSIGLGETIRVRLGDGDIAGIFEDMDETGALVLNRDGERRRITVGDVFFG